MTRFYSGQLTGQPKIAPLKPVNNWSAVSSSTKREQIYRGNTQIGNTKKGKNS
jgi:hypothetical protein